MANMQGNLQKIMKIDPSYKIKVGGIRVADPLGLSEPPPEPPGAPPPTPMADDEAISRAKKRASQRAVSGSGRAGTVLSGGVGYGDKLGG